jgi:hypothetical protein
MNLILPGADDPDFGPAAHLAERPIRKVVLFFYRISANLGARRAQPA